MVKGKWQTKTSGAWNYLLFKMVAVGIGGKIDCNFIKGLHLFTIQEHSISMCNELLLQHHPVIRHQRQLECD